MVSQPYNPIQSDMHDKLAKSFCNTKHILRQFQMCLKILVEDLQRYKI